MGEPVKLDIVERLLAQLSRNRHDTDFCDGGLVSDIEDAVAEINHLRSRPSPSEGEVERVARASDEHEARIAELLALKRNWNSYGSAEIKPEAADRARSFIGLLEAAGLNVRLVPVPDGGISVEGAGSSDCTIECTGEGPVNFYLDELSFEQARNIARAAIAAMSGEKDA